MDGAVVLVGGVVMRRDMVMCRAVVMRRRVVMRLSVVMSPCVMIVIDARRRRRNERRGQLGLGLRRRQSLRRSWLIGRGLLRTHR
jgi:hypothetical protein